LNFIIYYWQHQRLIFSIVPLIKAGI